MKRFQNNPIYQDPSYLRRDQYGNSNNLNARAQLHQRYSTNKSGWHKWLFSYLEIGERSRILDCGCGPGTLWKTILPEMPYGCRIHLVDLSQGMIQEARESLSDHDAFEGFTVANAVSLPFFDQSFDVIVANHMLYHVPQRGEALGEFSRLLKSGGQLVTSTNGAGHLLQLREMAAELLPDHSWGFAAVDAGFSLENGADQLAAQFPDVEVRRYDNELQVTSADDILNYILSSSEAKAMASTVEVGKLRRHLARKIAADGAVHISSDSGLFLARRTG